MNMAMAMVIGWTVCGVLAFGVTFGYFQNSQPELAWSSRYSDMGLSMFMSFGGPVSLVVVVLLSGFCHHGLRWYPLDAETSWRAHQHRWPSLSREQWERE